MLEFIKKLFGAGQSIENKPESTQTDGTASKYILGAFEDQADNRNIPLATIQSPMDLPLEFETDLSMFPVFDQGQLGTCVAHAFAITKMYLDYLEDKKILPYSRRFLYAMTRWYQKTDTTTQGLYPRQAAKVMSTIGMIVESPKDDNTMSHEEYCKGFVDEYNKNGLLKEIALKQRSGTFAFPLRDKQSFAQAIYQNKLVTASIGIDWSKIENDGTTHAPKNVIGLHMVVFCGRVMHNGVLCFKYRNSWGEYWGTNGYGFVPVDEIESLLWDAIVFVDVPNDLIERAKNMQFIFTTPLQQGMSGNAVKQLQKRLISYGLLQGTADGSFGNKTLQAVKDFQALKGLPTTGLVGAMTCKELNKETPKGQTKSKLDLWCEMAAKIENAKPELFNPGNIKCDVIMNKDAIAKDNRGFCIFPSYEKGYNAMRQMFIRAATLPDTATYRSTMTLYEFYKIYAPASDNNDPKAYAQAVAKHIGCTIDTQIKELV